MRSQVDSAVNSDVVLRDVCCPQLCAKRAFLLSTFSPVKGYKWDKFTLYV